MAADAPSATGASSSVADIQRVCKERAQRAREAQKPFVPVWRSNLAFAAGQHHLVYDPVADDLRHIRDMDPRAAERNLLTADRISEYRDAQLGELGSDDDRPQLLVAQESESAEETIKQLNQAAGFAWEHEWQADSALDQAYEYVVDLGTAAIRCRRDPNHGKVVDHQPFDQHGQPVTEQTHPQDWAALYEQGTMADGATPKFKPVREGRTLWEPYTGFQILTAPGVNHEDRLPWFFLVRPVPVDQVQDEYGAPAAGLTEDRDIASAMGLSTSQTVRDARSQGRASSGRLRDHVWLYTYFEMPCQRYPQGRVVVLASNDYVVLDVREQLDYQLPGGEFHSGVVFLHWRRLIDRFYSRAWIEPLKDPQRALNNDETYADEIVARGGPKVIVQKPLPEKPQGLPMEEVVVGDQPAPPIFHEGIGLPPALLQRRENLIDNLAHAAAMSLISLGENPPLADTYSALALLLEQESSKRSYIRRSHKRAIEKLMELSVFDIKRYWPEEKQILVAGDEDKISFATFRKDQIPDYYQAKVAKGAPQPRSQAAELKKIDAFWAAAEQSGLVNSDPASWVAWYVESINAGEAQEIPEPQTDSQTRMAEFENLLMRLGEQPVPADYDLLPVHLPKHREEQDRARAAEDMALFLRVQQHIDLSVKGQQENMARVASAQQQPSPLHPGPGVSNAPAGAPPAIFARGDFQQLASGN